MKNRINGKSFDVRIMGFKVHFESFNISIEDNSTVATNNGRPNGVLLGDISASGELVVDTANFMLLTAAAKAAGSFQELPTFPIDAYAGGGNARGVELMHVHAYECNMKVSDLLSIDPTSTDKTTHKIDFDVTGQDFIDINGVPYAKTTELDLV